MLKFIFFLPVLMLFACDRITSHDLTPLNADYNYSVSYTHSSDTLPSPHQPSTMDSVLLQFGSGFHNDTVQVVSSTAEYRELILSGDAITAYSGTLAMANTTRELRLSINHGPIILLGVSDKRSFFIRRNKNFIEVIALKEPARLR